MLQEETRAGQKIFWIKGRVDVNTAPKLQRDLEARLAGPETAVLDLGGVDYLSSAGLRLLLSLTRRQSRQGGSLTLCSLTPSVANVIEVAGLLPVFTVKASLEQALAG